MVRRVVHAERCPALKLSIVLASNNQIRALNRRFLGRNRPTDVLAFPRTQGKADISAGRAIRRPGRWRSLAASSHTTTPRAKAQPHHELLGGDSLGEIYVSREQAGIQARQYGVALREELLRLVLHGLLHLLGYSHRQMTKLERKYMVRSS
jgi:probable rRNA maturation factor